MTRRACVVVLSVMIATTCAFAEDWAQFGGPDRNGTSPETGLLREWPRSGPKLLWTMVFSGKYGTGRGWGAPTVAAGAVYLLGSGGEGRTVWCLNAADGEKVWEFPYAPRGKTKVTQPAWGYCPRASVTVSSKYAYSIDELGQLFCLDRKSGKEVWTVNMQDTYAPSDNDWKGWCATPLLIDGRLIFSAARSVGRPVESRWVALDAETGKQVWDVREAPRLKNQHIGGGDLFQTPTPAEFAGEACVVASGPSTIVAIRVKDGRIVWRHLVPPYITMISSPVVVDDMVLIWGNTTAVCVKVDRKEAPHESTTLWEKTNTPGSYAFNVPCGGTVYGWSGTDVKSITGPYVLRCVELATGKVAWETDRTTPYAIGVSVMEADGLLFARSAGKMMLVDADPKTFALKGEVVFTEKTGLANSGWVMPVLSDGRLFVRLETELRCYQVAKKLPAR